VQVVLTSRFAMWMAWGPDLTFFCNAAYRDDTLGVARSLGLSLCWLGIQHEDSTADGQEL